MSIVSAPGKVLLLGGYLVLDPDYFGLVVSVSARFYSRIISAKNNNLWNEKMNQFGYLGLENKSKDEIIIVVESPQVSGVTVYKYKNSFSIECIHGESNKFVSSCILFGLTACMLMKPEMHNESIIFVSLYANETFYTCKTDSMIKGKTGLGSSAALVASLVSCFYKHYDIESITSHDVAQIAHCVAQGKVGSGFDICAAFNGPIRYSRFSPKLLDKEWNILDNFKAVLGNFRNSYLDCKVSPLVLPPFINLVIGDVSGGSESPIMVSNVLNWRSSCSDTSEKLWNSIGILNTEFEKQLEKLNVLFREDSSRYIQSMQECSTLISDNWKGNEVSLTLLSLKNIFSEIRAKLKIMGEFSGVEIEPDVQTNRVLETMKLPGVLACGVPGAGGTDALFALILDINPQPSSLFVNFWKSLNINLLEVQVSNGGVVVESSMPLD